MSLNKVMLIGNAGTDSEIRYIQNNGNIKVARIRVATTERFTDRNGNATEHTEWHTVIAWRSLADLCEKYIKKGTQIFVEGKLQTREWTDPTGAKKFATEVIAEHIQLLGRAPQQAGATAPATAQARPAAPAPASAPAPTSIMAASIEDDDLPF